MAFQPVTKKASDVIKRVQRQFGDEAAVQITEEDILRYINDGQDEINRQNQVLKASSTGNIVGNQDSYDFPVENIIAVHSIRVNGITLEHKSVQEAEEWILNWDPKQTGRANPEFWWEWAGKFYIYPIPDTSVTDAITVLYLKPPTPVEAPEDNLSLPDIYFQPLMAYVMGQAYEMDEDWEASQLKDGKFTQSLQRLSGDDRANIHEYPMITVLPEDM